MDRREFFQGAVFTTVLANSGKVFAGNDGDNGLLRLQNADNPSVLEQKHIPAIEAPSQVGKDEWFDVKVRVGFVKEHPSTPEHWITEIKLLVNGQHVAKTDFLVGGVSPSEATFRIKLAETSKLEAVEHCNLHSAWIGKSNTVKV